jgi:hypothetical protein
VRYQLSFFFFLSERKSYCRSSFYGGGLENRSLNTGLLVYCVLFLVLVKESPGPKLKSAHYPSPSTSSSNNDSTTRHCVV